MGAALDYRKRVSYDDAYWMSTEQVEESVETENMEGGDAEVEGESTTAETSTPVITISTPADTTLSTTADTISTPVSSNLPTPVDITSTPVTRSSTPVITRSFLPPVIIREPSELPKPESYISQISSKDKGKGKMVEERKMKKVMDPQIDYEEARRLQEEYDERRLRMTVESIKGEDSDVDVILEDLSMVTLSKKAAQMLNEMAAQGQGLSAQQIHELVNKKKSEKQLESGFAVLNKVNEEKARVKRQAQLEKKKNKPPSDSQRKKELVDILGGRYAPKKVLDGWDLSRLEKAYEIYKSEKDGEFEKRIEQDRIIKKKLSEDRLRIAKEIRREEQEQLEMKAREEAEAKEKEFKRLSDANSKRRWDGVLAQDRMINDVDRDNGELRKYIKEIRDLKENVHINLDRSSRIVEWKGQLSKIAGIEKEQIQIIRENGDEHFLVSVSDVLKNVNRLDILDLHELIDQRNRSESVVMMERELERCLKMLFEPEPFVNLFLHCFEAVTSWRHFIRAGVHMVIFRDGMTIYMLDERTYALGTQTLRSMLAAQLRTIVISEGAFNAVYMVVNQFNKRLEMEKLKEAEKREKQNQDEEGDKKD